MTLFQPQDRDELLTRTIAMLEADQRLEGAVIDGSIGAGRADRWSDVDIACVVTEEVDCPTVTAEWVGRIYDEHSVAHHYEVAFESTLVRGFLLERGLVLDLSFTPASDFRIWAPVRVAFDRTGQATKLAADPGQWKPTPNWQAESGFAWHDVLHCAAATARNRRWQALFYLQRVRNRTLALASERRGQDASEFKHVDDLPPAERDPLLATIVGDLEPTSLLSALAFATEVFLTELARGDPELAARLNAVLPAYVRSAQVAVDEGSS